jgi:hypothetical protein
MAIHQPIDPAAILQAAFPHNLLDSKARECRFVLRRRDFSPVTFSWALITRILAHSCTSIASVWREYERLTGTSIDRSSFYKHFDFAEFKGPYDLGSWAVEKEASMLCHVYGVLLAWAASRRLRLEVIGLTSEINVPDEHLVAPLGRWARALQHHVRHRPFGGAEAKIRASHRPPSMYSRPESQSQPNTTGGEKPPNSSKCPCHADRQLKEIRMGAQYIHR